LKDLNVDEKNCAKEIIEEFMIAANGIAALYLESKQLPSFRRVVRAPKNWNRLVSLAAEHNYSLPSEPDAKALSEFLNKEKAADPEHYADLSLSVIKLLGPGEYAVQIPGTPAVGHFGLAVKDYSHSTAPNRRFADLITQRLLKSAIKGISSPYEISRLEDLALHCTRQEDAVKKVERQISKSAAALLLESRIGESFDAFVTGASNKGTWVRLLRPPVEGRLEHGFEGLEVGNKIRVELLSTDVENGFIDFKRI
jgi:exoribonuclease R